MLNQFTFGKTDDAVTLAKIINDTDQNIRDNLIRSVTRLFSNYNQILRSIQWAEGLSTKEKSHLLKLVRQEHITKINISGWPRVIRDYALSVATTRFRIRYRKLNNIESKYDD